MGRVLVCFVAADLGMNLFSIKNQIATKGLTQILLLYDNKNHPWKDWAERTVAEIKKQISILDVISIGIDPTNYDSTFKKLHDIITEKRKHGDEVIVDFTSTTNVAAAAVISAGILFGVEVYLLKPSEYILPEAKESIYNARAMRKAEGLVEIPLPKFEEELTEMETRILRKLQDVGGEAKSVADLLRKMGIKATGLEGTKNRGKYTYHVRQLEKRGLVRTVANRELRIQLTRIGSLLASIK